MPSDLPLYATPDVLREPHGSARLYEVDERLTRLDERARLLHASAGLRSPWSERLLFRNTCSVLHAQGCLLHLEDLVLLDGHAFGGVMYPDLSTGLGILRLWQSALHADAKAMLQTTMPGEAARPLSLEGDAAALAQLERPDAFYDRDWDQVGRIAAWRHAWTSAASFPPLLSSFIAWDAWHTLMPEQQGPWRAGLLAALALKARGRVQSWLLPVDTGMWSLRCAWQASEAPAKRLATFLDIVDVALRRADAELAGLTGARDRMLLRVGKMRKSSRAADLVDLLIARPLVSIPMACKSLRISKQAVAKLLGKLGSTPREISERRRYRYWTVP